MSDPVDYHSEGRLGGWLWYISYVGRGAVVNTAEEEIVVKFVKHYDIEDFFCA